MEVGEHCVKKFCSSDLRSFIFAFFPDHWALDCLLASTLKILTCSCYSHADFATNCKTTKCTWMSKEPPTWSLLFVGSATAFTHEKSRHTCLFSSVCDNNANWDIAHKQRKKLFWCCTEFINVTYKWAKMCHLCSLTLFRWDIESLFFFCCLFLP